ncbi:MAG: hypothetical protein KJO33_11420 [Gammaproteobacteria bacterium]|nr:hypothetical protein [Gammaproteobacteria bacterium]
MKKLTKILLFVAMSALSASIAAAPVGYSINSDGTNDATADSLYRIDMSTGVETRIGKVRPLGEERSDVEGLAFAPGGKLYGIDDSSLTLFSLNPITAVIQPADEVLVRGLPAGGGNDFGMTFACDGNLYITSVAEGNLYRMDLDGDTHLIGSLGGVNISALAAYGNPARLYGLGNGLDGSLQTDAPNLYEIDLGNGRANLIGPLQNAAPYSESGLSFDDAGQLWAITDRRNLDQPSQIMKINRETGEATEVKNVQATGEVGFESLAITEPRGCAPVTGDDLATFFVQKLFLDGNNDTPVTLNIQCNTGLPVQNSITVQPGAGAPGNFEVTFVVGNFQDGTLDCEVWEEAPSGYSAEYSCYTFGSCTTEADRCRFEGVNGGESNVCSIYNTPEPTTVTVAAEWFFGGLDEASDESVDILLECTNPIDGDGLPVDSRMEWRWSFDRETPPREAVITPSFDPPTECRTRVVYASSAVESESSCRDWRRVRPGDPELTCLVQNTIFFEGIPTLSPAGLLAIALLMLLTGAVGIRRL